jgi:geranylgeranyl pyrophosphate synthase
MREPRPGAVATGDGGAPAATPDASFLVPIRDELQAFEQRLRQTVHADLGPVADAMEYIVAGGGKRLRPALTILSARLGRPDIEQVYQGAMAIELIHNATLIHDDLIDRAPTRRGLRTIHESLGASSAIIIGDYYFAKGANLMSSIGNPRIDLLLSQAVMAICYGEMLELSSQRKYDQSLEEYRGKIERKTAALLAASAYVGGALGGLPEAELEGLRRYGHLLGMAFQIADDVLDYLSSEVEMGKPVGNDLKQGTVTLPLMLALKDPAAAPRLERVLNREPLQDSDYAEVVSLVRESRAIEDSYDEARGFSRRAGAELERFPDSPYREALLELSRYVVRRKH